MVKDEPNRVRVIWKDWELGFNREYFKNLERVRKREQTNQNKART